MEADPSRQWLRRDPFRFTQHPKRVLSGSVPQKFLGHLWKNLLSIAVLQKPDSLLEAIA
jgi:hypothetical protein